MSYRVADDRIDVGPVLVTFKEAVDGEGESFNRRPRVESYEENRGGLEEYRRRQEEGDVTID